MKVSRFHNLIGKLLVENRAGHLTVCIDKSTFRDNRESDGCVILEVCGAQIITHPMLDDDGGMAENKDGTERQRMSLVLYGSSGPTPGNPT